MDTIAKKYPIISIALAIEAVVVLQSFATGETSVLSGAMVQWGWCGKGDDGCLFWHYIAVCIVILVSGIIMQFIVNELSKNNKKKETPSVQNKIGGDRNITIIESPNAKVDIGQKPEQLPHEKDGILYLLIENSTAKQNPLVRMMVLSIKNKDGRNKIVDLHATTIIIDQFHIQSDEVVPRGYDQAESLLWTHRTVKTNLMPEASDGLLVAWLSPVSDSHAIHFGGYPNNRQRRFGFCKAYFEKESVFKYQIRFQGRYEKEKEYRKFIYTNVLYSNPSRRWLMSGNEALKLCISDMPSRLVHKTQQLQEEIKKESDNEQK